jgi:hypothetical protein
MNGIPANRKPMPRGGFFSGTINMDYLVVIRIFHSSAVGLIKYNASQADSKTGRFGIHFGGGQLVYYQ